MEKQKKTNGVSEVVFGFYTIISIAINNLKLQGPSLSSTKKSKTRSYQKTRKIFSEKHLVTAGEAVKKSTREMKSWTP